MGQTSLENIKKRWSKFLQKGQTIDFRKGQVLFYEGHDPYGVYVIEPTKVHFTKKQKPCSSESSWDCALGKVIGLEHILAGTPFQSTCTTNTNCQIIFIPRTHFTDS